LNPAYWGVIISGIGVVGTVVGIFLARAGKKGDQELQAVGDQFRRLMEENTFLAAQAREARLEARETRTEWEQRWDRQVTRCRKIADSATTVITRLMGPHTIRDETEAEVTLRDIRLHVAVDHNDDENAA